MHRAEEDYLKLIYELQVESGKQLIKNNEIKDAFGFTDQSVNDMIKRLHEQKLVNFKPYKGVSLTKKGISVAYKLVRAHRIWEVFLTKKLNYPWHKVHEEAENLEHASSEAMVEAMYQYLGQPERCSHGNPIPNIDGVVRPINDEAMTHFKVGQIFLVERASDDPKLLELLNKYQINLGSKLKIIEKDNHNEFIKVNVLDKDLLLTFSSAKKIFGRSIK
ncbi:metal-dependent transcriptional regulator [Acholeplasma granularum]|uniref:metal-dependent transcriptional regulator n=1 Tax=Acholeplasma granularum TaxID=264635 RepID=UPI00047253DC|nr:metal-dependent transcriptional regulator [Acholeplasma granularum]